MNIPIGAAIRLNQDLFSIAHGYHAKKGTLGRVTGWHHGNLYYWVALEGHLSSSVYEVYLDVLDSESSQMKLEFMGE